MPWLTPQGPVGPYRTYFVRVPYSVELEADYKGALLDLQSAENWEQFGELTPDEIAEIWTEVNEFNLRLVRAMPIGSIVWSASSDIPDDYLVANGAELDSADYPELYTAIGTVWGGSGGRFNLPDLVNRTVVGAGDDFSLGDTGGEAQHTLTVNEMPAHTHGLYQKVEPYGGSSAKPMLTGQAIPYIATESTGGSQPHNNMPPYAALTPLILCR